MIRHKYFVSPENIATHFNVISKHNKDKDVEIIAIHLTVDNVYSVFWRETRLNKRDKIKETAILILYTITIFILSFTGLYLRLNGLLF